MHGHGPGCERDDWDDHEIPHYDHITVNYKNVFIVFIVLFESYSEVENTIMYIETHSYQTRLF